MENIVSMGVEEGAWCNSGVHSKVEEIARSVIKYLKVDELRFNLLLTTDAKVRELNAKFTSSNKVTNVLTFPADKNVIRYLKSYGDIVIPYRKVLNEAKEKGIDFVSHFTHLLIHSILHLLSYDHKNEKQANVMENLEIAILKHYFDIENPYLEKQLIKY